MIELRSVAEVRAAEEDLLARLPDGVLMQRAAHALAVCCIDLLRSARGSVMGARVVLAVGSGNNGGDALFAGAQLAARGCRVVALALSDRIHVDGRSALLRAGGRVVELGGDPSVGEGIVAGADVVIDGILGIGGIGALRPEAATLAATIASSGVIVMAVDVPSGVDADTGAVDGAVVSADITVTFGAVKPGLVLTPGALHSGGVRLVDIGLTFDAAPTARIIEGIDVEPWVREPTADDYKYRRGVVGVAAGSGAYPGAALLATAAARHGNLGMTRFLDRADGAAAMVVSHYPDIVVDGSAPASQVRADAWTCGPGFPGDGADADAVRAVLAARVPVILDAGALTVLAEHADVRHLVEERHAFGLTTVLTPHEGEFDRMLPGLLARAVGRLDAARQAASTLGAVVVLKGPGTVIAPPDGPVWIDTEGTADLATAGSGDVLSGLIGALLAGAWAGGRRDLTDLAEATAAAVWLHGAAGRVAAVHAPVTATDIAAAVPAAIRLARFGGPKGTSHTESTS